MTLEASITAKLQQAFAPERLVIINESHLHAGHHHSGSDHHGSFDGSGETHFRVRLVSAAFAGMSRIAQHRLVMDVFAGELGGSIHAMALTTKTPS
jgi:BolA protein